MAVYSNQFKGRPNRTQRARHLRDEFERIARGFSLLLSFRTKNITNIFDGNKPGGGVATIDPANGLIQEVALTSDTLIQIKDPVADASLESRRVILIVHGANLRIINGWGPQTWKERGNSEWTWLFTGAGDRASALLEFWWDGFAWVCVASTKNQRFSVIAGATQITYPFVSDLLSTDGDNELTLARTSHAMFFDTNENWVFYPPNTARFAGARAVTNWVATSGDLQSVAWETKDASLSASVGGGPDGQDVDVINFTATDGEVRTWLLPHVARASVGADPVKFVVSFQARMDSVSSGKVRGLISSMEQAGTTSVRFDRTTFNLTNQWRRYAAVLDPVTAGDGQAYDLTILPRRTLTKFAFQAPSGSNGDAIRVTDVQVEVLRASEPEVPGELVTTAIGTSMALSETPGSTGTWDNGTKSMTMVNGEFVDLRPNLDIGGYYLCVARRTSGTSVNVIMESGRMLWEAYANGVQDSRFVKDAAFVFQYQGGGLRFQLSDGATTAYTINVYAIDGATQHFSTEAANQITAAKTVLEIEGPPASSNLVEGLGIELDTATNLIPVSQYRDFTQWDAVNLVSGNDNGGRQSSFRGGIGIDGVLGTGSILQDSRQNASGYLNLNVPITDDTEAYAFSIFVRKTWSKDGPQIVKNQYDQLITGASRFMDVEVALTGGTVPVADGDRLRYAIRAALITPQDRIPAGFESAFAVNYDDWLRLRIVVRNNGTGNDSCRIRIRPAPAFGLDAPLNAGARGWIVVDWAQLEIGEPSSPIVGGATRTPESFTGPLGDGLLYDENFNPIGSVVSNALTFDTEGIRRAVLWSGEAITSLSADSLHQLGPPASVCADVLRDAEDEPILDESLNQICVEAGGSESDDPPDPALISGMISWLKASETDHMTDAANVPVVVSDGDEFVRWREELAAAPVPDHWGFIINALKWIEDSNGYPAVTVLSGFDTSISCKNAAGLAILPLGYGGDEVTIFAAVSSSLSGEFFVGSTINDFGSGGNKGGYALRIDRSADVRAGTAAANTAGLTNTPGQGTFDDSSIRIVALRGTGTDGEIEGWLNGVSSGVSNLSSNNYAPTSGSASGKLFKPNAGPDHANRVFIHEWIMYQGDLTDQEVVDVIEYLAFTYGVT